MGMVMITEQTEKLGLSEQGCAEKIRTLLHKFSLPTDIEIAGDEIIPIIGLDKKKSGKMLNLILISDIGKGFIKKISFNELPNYLKMG